MRAKPILWMTCCLVLASRAKADSVDDYVRKQMARQHVPAVSIAVLIKDKVVKLKGYGKANLELDKDASADTVYEVGSLTKQFTATAILMLAEEDKLGLDDKVSKYLPGSPDTWKDVTIRSLLNHTSGIKSYTSDLKFESKMRLDETQNAIFQTIADYPLEFPTGSKFEYSNSGYYLLGMIVEKASGEPYAQFLKEHVFDPLGMKSTSLNDWSDVVANRASGYEWSNDGFTNASFISMNWPFAAGALMSSAEDFSKWAAALFDKKLLKQESFDTMYAGAKLSDGKTAPYGCGWAIRPFRGHDRIWHNGGINGFSSDIMRWPSDDLTVIVFTNCECDADAIASGISGLYIPAVRPLSELGTHTDPDPAFTEKLKGLLVSFSKGNSNVDCATDDVKKLLTPDNQKIFSDIGDHMVRLSYLDADEPSGGLKRLYYRIERDKGAQFLTVAQDKEGKVAGIVATQVE